MIGLSSDHLREHLDLFRANQPTQQILIIDCRSFLAHNDSHIMNSINPPCLRRKKTPSLTTLITDTLTRDRLLSNYYCRIILYDEVDFTNDSFGARVAQCLQEAGIKTINYLEGGFSGFKKQYPLLCTTNNLNSAVFLSSLLNGKPSNSQYIYTWPFKSKSQPHSPVCGHNSTPGKEEALYNEFSNLFFSSSDDDVDAKPAEILPYLYLGNESHASSKSLLQELGITAVLNVSHNCTNYFEDQFAYKRISIRDSKSEDIYSQFDEAIDFINRIKEEESDGKVLVHCHAGISRSATICIAYLIHERKMRMEEAYEFVKSKRGSIMPNFNFMTQLMEFEKKTLPPITTTTTTTMTTMDSFSSSSSSPSSSS